MLEQESVPGTERHGRFIKTWDSHDSICDCGRLYMLEEQCNTWQGITSVAVYYPLYIFQNTNADRLREAITTVESFHEQIDRSHGERREQVNAC